MLCSIEIVHVDKKLYFENHPIWRNRLRDLTENWNVQQQIFNGLHLFSRPNRNNIWKNLLSYWPQKFMIKICVQVKDPPCHNFFERSYTKNLRTSNLCFNIDDFVSLQKSKINIKKWINICLVIKFFGFNLLTPRPFKRIRQEVLFPVWIFRK